MPVVWFLDTSDLRASGDSGLVEMFANTHGSGVWARSSTNGKYRLCNHKHPCKGLPLVIFDGAVPAYDWASIPPTYVSAGSCIEMVVANGTIVPSCLVRHSRFAAHWASSVSLPGVGDAVLLSSAPPASNPQALVNQHGKRRLEEASSSLPLASTKLDGHQPSREDRGGSSSCSMHSSTVGKTSSTSPFQERMDGADAGCKRSRFHQSLAGRTEIYTRKRASVGQRRIQVVQRSDDKGPCPP